MIDEVVARADLNVLLSRRNPPSAGVGAIDEFEDLLHRLDGMGPFVRSIVQPKVIRRPPGQMAVDMLGWSNALIEVPDAPPEAVEFVKAVLSDTKFVCETRRRNVVEMCRRHDWRYCIRDIYQHFQLSLPESLTTELVALEKLADRLALDRVPG